MLRKNAKLDLLRRVPLGEVLRMTLLGLDERMSSSRAFQIGLVSEVLPRAELRPRAQVLAERLAAKPPLAVQGTVKAIWDGYHMTVQGQREIPLLYPRLANPVSKLELDEVEVPPFEIR